MKLIWFGIFLIGTCFAEPQLQLVNVVFRHGPRTPAPDAIFPTDRYFNSSFYPIGLGGLTNDGKYQIYKLGEFLRKKYNGFIADVYVPNLLYARSTDVDRTKMSLQLVLAALFPPSDLQKWHPTLDWQPIPYRVVPKSQDDVLGVTSQASFNREKERVSKTEFIQNRFKQFEAFLSQLENLTGKKMTTSYEIAKIYDTLYCEWKMNLELPSWSKEMFPNGELLDAALIDYDVMTYDKNMTYELAGKLAAKIRDTILGVARGTAPEGKKSKLYLYSGHEVNVVGALKSLQVYDKHIPTFASAAIIELLKEDDEYYVQVLYYHGETFELEEMKMPGCPILCPLEKYLVIVNELLN